MSALPYKRIGLLYLNSLSLALFAYGGMNGSNVNKKVAFMKLVKLTWQKGCPLSITQYGINGINDKLIILCKFHNNLVRQALNLFLPEPQHEAKVNAYVP